MKTASEWASEYKDAICWANEEGQCGCEGACNLLLKFARAIQADAIRAAAERLKRAANSDDDNTRFSGMLFHHVFEILCAEIIAEIQGQSPARS